MRNNKKKYYCITYLNLSFFLFIQKNVVNQLLQLNKRERYFFYAGLRAVKISPLINFIQPKVKWNMRPTERVREGGMEKKQHSSLIYSPIPYKRKYFLRPHPPFKMGEQKVSFRRKKYNGGGWCLVTGSLYVTTSVPAKATLKIKLI